MGGPWPVHDALPQPGPRGPRHDGPVRGDRSGGPRRRPDGNRRQTVVGQGRGSAVNATAGTIGDGATHVTPRRTVAIDTVIVASCAAAFAHLVAAPGHYTWWPASGLFFAVLGIGQLAYAVALQLGA